MSAPLEEQILDQIQHYPDAEYMNVNGHTHRCYTILYNDHLYYTNIDPFNRGARRRPATIRMSIGYLAIPPITQTQLIKLTSAVPLADVKALFTPEVFEVSNAMSLSTGDPMSLFSYAVFITNMRAYKHADSTHITYTVRDTRDVEYIAEIIAEPVFWLNGLLMNYAQMIVKNPAYAYCDAQLLSCDYNGCVTDRTGTQHIPKCISKITWACRYVPLGTQIAPSMHDFVLHYKRDIKYRLIIIIDYCCSSYGHYNVRDPIISWLIERGLVFHVYDGRCMSVCENCYDSGHCIRTRAGEPYTCMEISRSYYWQYRVLTAFGQAEHARYVQVCKMIYG